MVRKRATVKQWVLTAKLAMPSMVCLAYLSSGCGGGTTVPKGDENPIPGEGLTREQAIAADALPSQPPKPWSEVYLADGRTLQEIRERFGTGGLGGRQERPLTPTDRKAVLIAAMIAEGERLIDDSNFIFPNEGPNRPAQNGLAYSYGGKQISRRERPPSGCCTHEVYGLDCSGFVAMCARAAGLNIVSGPASTQGLAATWNRVIPPEWRLEMRSVEVADGNYETGDIICWGGHIGIVVGSDVMQSNGTSGCSNPAAECAANLSPNRGPRRMSLVGAISAFGNPRSVLRLVPQPTFTVQLNWGPEPDVDLHVFEPNGAHVYFGNKQGRDGFLDVDDVTSFGPEHYFIRETPQLGDYHIGVVYYRGYNPEVARIIVTVNTESIETITFTQPLERSTGGINPIMVATVRVSEDANGRRSIQVLPYSGGRSPLSDWDLRNKPSTK